MAFLDTNDSVFLQDYFIRFKNGKTIFRDEQPYIQTFVEFSRQVTIC